VGSKGELFPPKRMRESLGLNPQTRVIFREEEGKLIVEPIHRLEDILAGPPVLEITLEEFHASRRELFDRLEYQGLMRSLHAGFLIRKISDVL